jgi:glyceraldehyde 3-phosphate dehydrogenase
MTSWLLDCLQVEDKPVVSMDVVNNPHSSIVDAISTMVIHGSMIKIYAGYDNEWGCSNRMAEIGKMVVDKLQ